MIFLLFWIIGLIVGIVTTILNPSLRDITSISNNLLFYQLTLSVTMSGISGFFGHVFFSDKIAESIGWAKGNPFQKELGFAELGFIVTGILCNYFKGNFWLAVIIAFSSLFLGAAIIHIKEMVVKKNFKPYNAITVIPDILIPITLIILSITGNLWK